jgi:hypothetical protein
VKVKTKLETRIQKLEIRREKSDFSAQNAERKRSHIRRPTHSSRKKARDGEECTGANAEEKVGLLRSK